MKGKVEFVLSIIVDSVAVMFMYDSHDDVQE